jgi:hypothetical protein
MRLYEVEDRFINDLILLLNNVIGGNDSHSAGKSEDQMSISYPALNDLLINQGYSGIDYDVLKKLYDKHRDLQKLIHDPQEDEQEIKLKTEADPMPGPSGVAKGPGVDQMAKKGAQDFQQDLG